MSKKKITKEDLKGLETVGEKKVSYKSIIDIREGVKARVKITSYKPGISLKDIMRINPPDEDE